ncbi:MAG: hypothetical protein L6367_10720 [Cellulomonas sp.]|nr:hypothetical protein [Cellulomonas sp.]
MSTATVLSTGTQIHKNFLFDIDFLARSALLALAFKAFLLEWGRRSGDGRR